MARLHLENLSKTFSARGTGDVPAIDGFSLEIADGELLVLLGPSGCGKTTLLRLIAGLEQPSSGRVLLDGRPVNATPPQDRGIAMAFQYPALLPQLNVQQNIALGPKLRGASAAEASERAREIATLVGIGDLLGRAPETLSGGQQQRVSLARALANRPEVLLLDEPLANLDPASRSELRDAIRTVQKTLRVTTLYVTHDQAEAAAIADRIALMNRGVLQQAGSAAELYRDPRNRFVAEFFSPERPNIFNAEIREGRLVLEAGVELPINVRREAKVVCVIRRDAFHPGGPPRGIIRALQHTGWSTTLDLDLKGTILKAEIPFAPHLKDGEEFDFGLAPADILLFDRSSGERIRI